MGAAKKFIVVNKNDRTLKPFVIYLPKPPAIKKIEGWRKDPKDQYFKRVVQPERLVALEEKLEDELKTREVDNRNHKFSKQKLIVAMWDYLKDHTTEYAEEIEFIKQEHHRLTHGHWIMINGTPLYIPKWFYRYLNYWTLDEGKPVEFRMRDWEYFIVHEWAYNNTEDENYLDRGFRTIYGVTYPKHRRDGATNKSLCILLSIQIESGIKKLGGIQSFDKDNAKEHYVEKLLPAFDIMPFYTKPLWFGGDMPIGQLKFVAPAGARAWKTLGSRITYATTSAKKFYDGKKQAVHLCDESGKTKEEDVMERHEIVKHTIAEADGADINGFMMYPTTVDEMVGGGGAAFKRLCDQSYFHDRNEKTGQTKSGLINYFKAACYGLQGFIDRFGEDIVENPSEEDLWKIPTPRRDGEGKLYGARTHLSSKRQALLDSGKSEDLERYSSSIRLFPLEYIECFGGLDGDVGFDTVKLKRRRDDLLSAETLGERPTRKGYFIWRKGESTYTSQQFIEENLHKVKGFTDDAVVEWIDDEVDGTFFVSYLPRENNLRFHNDGIWYPENPEEYTHCGDPFMWLTDSQINNVYRDKSNTGSLSRGGLAVFRERDFGVDPITKDVSLWKTHTFVSDYLYRPKDINIYCEDAIMQMVFFGGMMFPEVNVKDLWRYIYDRGFEGYLLYHTNEMGVMNKTPGFNSLTGSKQSLFSVKKSYITHHVHRDNHYNIIRQDLAIQGLDDMTNQDLFTASAGCLYGSKSRFREYIDYSKEEKNVVDYFSTYDL